jgi:mannose-6-phosphate isomerase-like protein (cupin superfamily)
MTNISDYINSGIIESYVLGLATTEEQAEVDRFASLHAEVRHAINSFGEQLEREAFANAITPDPLVKPMVMATVDFIARMEKGESPSDPPTLNEHSKISDYDEWLNRPDMVLPAYPENIYAKIIASTPQVTTIVAWIKDISVEEIHHDEHEKFLIVEGSCTLTIAGNDYNLHAGDYFSIPLHQYHSVKVTSDTICKTILQRSAA